MVASPLHVVTDAAEDVSEYHIEAQTSLVERSLRTLKHGDAFAVLDAYGDIGAIENTAEGLFFRDMRHLSRFQLWFAGRRPLLLSSVMQDDNAALSVDMTNPDIEVPNGEKVHRDTIALERLKFLWDDACYERISVRNFDQHVRRLQIGFNFDADFKDLFEVRGVDRIRRGSVSTEIVGPDEIELRYVGLDDATRITRLKFSPTPRVLEPRRAIFDLTLEAGARTSIAVTVTLDAGEPRETSAGLLAAYSQKRRAMRAGTRGIATVSTSNGLLNEILCQSTADLHMLLTDTPHGRYPYAGIPWYSTVFGRDGIITAMLMLWLDPCDRKGRADLPRRDAGHARGSGCRCAAWQDPARAPPGRNGDARRGAVPPLLRHRRRHASLRHARRHVLRTYRRPRYHRRHLAQHQSRAALDRHAMAIATAMASSNISAKRRRAWPTKAGKTATIPFFMPTAVPRKARSPSSRFRPTSMRPSKRQPPSPCFLASRGWQRVC